MINFYFVLFVSFENYLYICIRISMVQDISCDFSRWHDYILRYKYRFNAYMYKYRL